MNCLRIIIVAVLSLGTGLGMASRAAEPTAEELRSLPLLEDVPGDLPDSGVRYWKGLRPLNARGAYVSVVHRNGLYEIWSNDATGDPHADSSQNHVVVYRGKTLGQLGPREIVFDTSIVNDVFDPAQPEVLAPARLFTHTSMTHDPEFGYILLACVPPTYSPGAVPMLPTLTTSTNGLPGTWLYRGKLKGEILEEAAQRRIWCDGGSLHRLGGGRWRVYLNGFGTVLAAAEAPSLDGPWKFLRNAEGQIREILPQFPRQGRYGGCFPTVLHVGPDEWHAWITDTWPPQAIWHFSSTDGVDFRRYGRQPEITRRLVGNHGIKCLRAFVDPGTQEIVGLLSVMTRHGEKESGWQLHELRMPAGMREESE